MTWDFTPTQVMSGEVKYTLDDFKRDLYKEVADNFGDRLNPKRTRDAFNLIFTFCHARATEKSLDWIELELKGNPDRKFLEALEEANKDNVDMLRAIIQRLFLDYFSSTLKWSFGDEDKATEGAINFVNSFIKENLEATKKGREGIPHKRNL